jgi:hypothetical protein
VRGRRMKADLDETSRARSREKEKKVTIYITYPAARRPVPLRLELLLKAIEHGRSSCKDAE